MYTTSPVDKKITDQEDLYRVEIAPEIFDINIRPTMPITIEHPTETHILIAKRRFLHDYAEQHPLITDPQTLLRRGFVKWGKYFVYYLPACLRLNTVIESYTGWNPQTEEEIRTEIREVFDGAVIYDQEKLFELTKELKEKTGLEDVTELNTVFVTRTHEGLSSFNYLPKNPQEYFTLDIRKDISLLRNRSFRYVGYAYALAVENSYTDTSLATTGCCVFQDINVLVISPSLYEQTLRETLSEKKSESLFPSLLKEEQLPRLQNSHYTAKAIVTFNDACVSWKERTANLIGQELTEKAYWVDIDKLAEIYTDAFYNSARRELQKVKKRKQTNSEEVTPTRYTIYTAAFMPLVEGVPYSNSFEVLGFRNNQGSEYIGISQELLDDLRGLRDKKTLLEVYEDLKRHGDGFKHKLKEGERRQRPMFIYKDTLWIAERVIDRLSYESKIYPSDYVINIKNGQNLMTAFNYFAKNALSNGLSYFWAIKYKDSDKNKKQPTKKMWTPEEDQKLRESYFFDPTSPAQKSWSDRDWELYCQTWFKGQRTKEAIIARVNYLNMITRKNIQRALNNEGETFTLPARTASDPNNPITAELKVLATMQDKKERAKFAEELLNKATLRRIGPKNLAITSVSPKVKNSIEETKAQLAKLREERKLAKQAKLDKLKKQEG